VELNVLDKHLEKSKEIQGILKQSVTPRRVYDVNNQFLHWLAHADYLAIVGSTSQQPEQKYRKKTVATNKA